MTRETVGKVATDLLKKQTNSTSAVEQTEENLTKYEEGLIECLEKGKKENTGDFYVIVLTKNEQLLRNVFRNFFFTRSSCPTPDWDQTLYKYKRKDDNLVFMWTIPSRDACSYLTTNALQVSREERPLLQFVLAFNDGTLMKLAKELNGEKAENPELEDFTWKG